MASGHREVRAKTAYLDQQLSILNRQKTVLEQLLAVNSQMGESQLRMQLAQLGLDVTRLSLPCGKLSQYQGTLMVVSHDEVFLSQIELTHWLVAGDKGREFSSHKTFSV